MSVRVPSLCRAGAAAAVRLANALTVLLLITSAADIGAFAQTVGPNVNMVSGTQWPGGDPFLQRQNEPSMAISSRNSLHIVAGANDYRTVDLPGITGTDEPTGDAWLGFFTSYDGGQTWTSTLVPGYPQDTSLAGTLSPLKGLQAGADPLVRAGANGMFFFSGLAFDRAANGASEIFVAAYIDDNDSEAGNSIRYLWTSPVYYSNPARQQSSKNPVQYFEDKPALAVDVPRSGGGVCVVPGPSLKTIISGGEVFPAGNIYVAWTQFTGGEDSTNAQILFTRSVDCGLTWSAPTTISTSGLTSQGAQIAVDPNNGTVYVVWRVFASGTTPDELMYAASTDGGRTFTKGTVITPISPFDQGTTGLSFRTNAYAALAIDNSSRLYVGWTQRGANGAPARIEVVTGVPSTSSKGVTVKWSAPVVVDANPASPAHQIMPALAFSAGKLTVAWYDLRNDDLLFVYSPVAGGGQYSITLQNDGGTPDFPSFGTYIEDPAAPYAPDARRQTLDVRAAQATPANVPVFFPSVQVSSYAFGSLPGSSQIQQLYVNPPNLPMFQSGTLPFFGDYVDVAGPTFVPNQNGTWRYNNQPSDPDFTHVVWTDNRDVVAPADGNWADYVPPTYGSSTTSIFDPTQQRQSCTVTNSGQTGDRNQNIYTAQLSPGLTLSAPGNSKPLGYVSGSTTQLLQRAYPVIVANTTAQLRSYQLTIASQPAGGAASFLQTSPLAQITVEVPPLSSTSRTVFATSTNAHAVITVNASEVTAGVTSPETASIALNSDPSNPSPSTSTLTSSENYTPTISNPNIGNPNIGNPNIGNPNIGNPNIGNPNIGNPNIGNPNIGNPNIGNPNIGNADVANPNIGNPNIGNTSLANATISDGTWTVTNTGNTSSAYTVNLFGQTPPSGVMLQLILYENYNTPTAQGCALSLQSHFVPVANITNVSFATLASILQPAALNPSAPALTLAPGQSALITVRAYDLNTNNPAVALQQYNPITQTSPVVAAQAANTGATQPPVTLTILTKSLPAATLTGAYGSQTLQATGGSGTYTWSIVGTAPAGVTLKNNVLSWNAQGARPGTLSFTVQVSDAAGNTAQQSLSLVVNPAPAISPATLPPAAQNAQYSQALAVSGGTPPFGPWTLAPGSVIPNWLTLNSSTGTLSGVPPSGGTFPFAIQITDANGVTASQAYSLVVTASGVSIGTAALPSGQYNSPYTPFALSASNGTPPYTWSVANGGVLPAGMTLNPSSGSVSGTPSQAGVWTIPVTVTDSASPATTQTANLQLTVGLATGYAATSTTSCNMPYPATPLYYTGATSWSIASSTLPTSGQLAILQNNVLTGCLAATASGNYSLQLTATTASGSSSVTLPLLVVGQDQQSNGTVSINSGGGNHLPPSGYQQGVATPGYALDYLPGSWSLVNQNFTGSFLFGFTGSAPQFCSAASGSNTNTLVPLTVPSQPGRYDIAFDATTQTCSQGPAFPANPAPIVIDSVDAVPATVSIGGATVSNVSISPVAGDGAVATSNVLEIQGGGTGPYSVTVQFSYSIIDTACPDCIDQIEVGLNSDSGPQACAYNGLDGPAGASGAGNVTITVPNTPGRYYIAVDRGQDNSCFATTHNWWNGQPLASRYIGAVDVYQPTAPPQ